MIAPATLEAGCTEVHVSSFSYDAAEDTGGKRKPVSNRLQSADASLNKKKRQQTTANARDLWRNFTLAGWAIRKHLDYTTQFTFQCRTKNKDFNKEFEKRVKKASKRKNFDIAKRHSLRRFLRIMECCSVVDHDIGVVKLKSGHSQAIEADRIQTPPKVGKDESWTQGVRTDSYGAAIEYGVYNRGTGGKGYEFAGRVKENNFWLHGHFDRIDQYRGSSPMVSAINSMRDVYEGIDFGLAKLKVEQLYAFIVKRDATKRPQGPKVDNNEADEEGYNVSLDGRPIFLDMDPGDDADFLRSDAPGSNTVPFLNAVIAIALKSLDIPYSFYDESFTNFFGSRAAWQHYQRSCVDKHDRGIEFLDWWTEAFTIREVLAGLKLPDGLTVQDEFWEWVPDGMPWWDPVKEINGDNMAINSGFDTPQDVVKKRGTGTGDFYDNVDAIAEANAYALEKGVKLDFKTFLEPIQVVEANA